MVTIKDKPFWCSIQATGVGKKTQQLWTLASPILLLGYNVFSGNPPTTALGTSTDVPLYPDIEITQWPNLGNPKKLIGGNDPWSGRDAADWTNAPGLYIVAVNKNFLEPEDVSVIPGIPSKNKWDDEDSANWGSIVMTLIWKDPSSGGATVSLYAGGKRSPSPSRRNQVCKLRVQ